MKNQVIYKTRGHRADIGPIEIYRLVSTSQIQILLHCADVALAKRVDTSEGIEVCFATNFLSPCFIK